MTIEWCRLWHDMPTDPKFRTIAKRAGRPVSEVLALFTTMLANASGNDNERGVLLNWCHEDMGVALDIEPEHVEAIYTAMQGKLLDGDRLTGWERRQPKREDGSAERAKEWRERKRTQANAEKRPDSDSEKIRNITTTSEQEPAREVKEVQKFDLSGVELGSARPVSLDTVRQVARSLKLGDAQPLADSFHRWQGKLEPCKRAKDPDALFLTSAAKFFKNASPAVRDACQPLKPPEPEIKPRNVRASPQLLARLSS